MNPPYSTSGAVLPSAAQAHAAQHTGAINGRKRYAEDDLEDSRPLHRQSVATTATGSGHTTGQTTQSRKVLAPGATKAAMARLAELRAQGAVGGPPVSSISAGSTAAAAVISKKAPAPGATQAAMARLAAGRGSVNNLDPANSVSAPLPPVAALVVPPSHRAPPTATNGPMKMPAPGATQAAMARLASMKAKTGSSSAGGGAVAAAGGSYNSHFSAAPAAGGPNALPPPSRPLFTAADFSLGTVVWAKMQSYPWWPAQVQRPSPEQMRLRHAPSDIFIVFYGTADYTWLPMADLRPFKINTPEYSRFAGSKNKSLQRAIDEAWISLGQPRPDVLGRVAVGGR